MRRVLNYLLAISFVLTIMVPITGTWFINWLLPYS